MSLLGRLRGLFQLVPLLMVEDHTVIGILTLVCALVIVELPTVSLKTHRDTGLYEH